MSLDIESLRLLLAVQQYGSLGAAARSLSISQPAASARLRSMEARHGLRLVARSPRGSMLTEDGEAVCTWAADLMNELAGLEAGVDALSARRRGDLLIAASLTIAEYLMPRWLAKLQRELPDVHAGLRVVNSTDVVAMVRDGRVHIGFIEGPTAPNGLHMQQVGSDRIAVVVRPDHPWAWVAGGHAQPVTAGELAATALVLREPGSGTRKTFVRALGAEPNVALEAGSTSALIGAALNGVGPAVVSEVAVRTAFADGSLVDVPVALDLHRPLRAVWRASERLRSPASELVAIASRPLPRPDLTLRFPQKRGGISYKE